MGYFYAIMWLAVGLVLIFSVSKENKIFYFAGAFFVFLGGWWLVDSILPENLFASTWSTVLQIVTFAALIVLSVAFFIERQKTLKQQVLEQKKNEEALQAEAERLGEMLPEASADGMSPDPADTLRAGVAGVNLMKPRLDDEGEENEKPESEEEKPGEE